MELDSDENYLVSQARKFKGTDSATAKAWLITAKTLYPNSFKILFEAYKLEKESKNFEEAANCFSNIALNFQSQNAELWNEVNELTNGLRASENEITPAQEFYVKMFQHVSHEVQQKILLHTVNNTENSIQQCKLLLLILKRFPQAAITHSPRLLEMIADGMKQDPQKYQEMLIEEALPLILHKPPEMPPAIVCRLFTVSFEYYIRQIIDDDNKCDNTEIWKKIFQVLMLCGKILKWETFLPFNKTWGQNVYWEKLIKIVSISKSGSIQVLFYATTLFIYSLHCYIKNCYIQSEDAGINHVLVEGFSTDLKMQAPDVQSMEPPQISLTTPASKDITKAFVHAAQCWQLLNTEQFLRDFSKLLLTLPLAAWISRFLFDLAIYFGHLEEAKKLMGDMMVTSSLVQNLQLLSLNLLQGNLTLQGFEYIVKILDELPTTQGHFLEHLTLKLPRHMVFIPLTQKALIQYCTKAIINTLSRKLYEPNCPDQILGDLLVLLQLDYPRETLMAEQIFTLITSRRAFSYRLFTTYIVTIDFIEEFLHIWNTHNEDFAFDLSPAQSDTSVGRVGTRGSDKGAREDFRMIIKQQTLRANDVLTTVIKNFIQQEQIHLVQNMFGVAVTDEVGF